jgi:asparagine synthase (glutamine-hydrolysing)
VIDPKGGRQSIGNEDGTVQVVFNGEIYNHQELRRELESHGRQVMVELQLPGGQS